MNQNCNLFSNNTKAYLNAFYTILEEMNQGMAEGFDSVANSESISVYFIKTMIPHHQAAIKMCTLLLRYTTNIPLETMAQDIIKTQSSGVEQMRRLLTPCGEEKNTPAEVECYLSNYQKILSEMICKMSSAPKSNSIDYNFVNEMIPHHQGAVCMAKNALKYRICPELKTILTQIIKEQTKGIITLKKYRTMFC